MTVLFTDPGTGADQSPLSGNFTTLAPFNGLRRTANRFGNITASSDSAALITAGTFPNDQWCEVEVGVLGTPDGGPLLRGSNTGNGVFITSYDALQVYAFSIVAGSFNQEDNDTGTYVLGSIVYFEVQGNAYISKVAGVTINSFTFTGLASGRPGMFMYDGTLRFINLRAGDFATGSDISPTGIASPRATGSHTIATAGGQTISPTGVASPRATGSHHVQKEVASAGIPSAAVYGAHTIQDVILNLAPTGIASPRQTGSHAVADVVLNVSPAGIASARVTGSHVVANAAAQSIAPTGVTSPRATGSHSIQDVILNLAPIGVASPSALGSHVVTTAGTITISPTGVASPRQTGSHTLAQPVQSLLPTGISSARTTGTEVIANAAPQQLSMQGVPTATAFGSLIVSNGTKILAPAGVPSAVTYGSLVITTANVKLIQPAGVGAVSAVGTPTLAPTTPQSLLFTGVASARAVGFHGITQTPPPVFVQYLGETQFRLITNYTVFTFERGVGSG